MGLKQHSNKQLDEMERNALALRTMADRQLKIVEQLRSAAQRPIAKKGQIEIEAGLMARLLTGGQRRNK